MSDKANLTIRNCWPNDEAFNGTCKNPPVKRVE